MNSWRLELLGGFRLYRDEELLESPGRMAELLLSYLGYHHQQPQTRESLAVQLWPDADLSGALGSLRVLLTRLRDRLGESLPLHVERRTLQLDGERARVDVSLFEQTVRQGRVAEAAQELRLQALERALTLYQGPLLPRSDEFWAGAARHRLAELHYHACIALVQLYEQAGREDEGLLIAQRAIDADPLREMGHQARIRLLMRRGDHPEAHRHYEALTELLLEKLRTTPSAATRALLLTPTTPRSMPTPVSDALPTPLTAFFGRNQEKEALLELLRSGRRLITITGPGGVGKTRFALQATRGLGWERALHWAPLADLSPESDLPVALLSLLGGKNESNQTPQIAIVKLLGEMPTLLLLDNLEHLPDGQLHSLVTSLLQALPRLTILATSRRALHLSGEQVFPLAPLPVPEGQEETASVQLFVDRARLLRPDFDDSDRASIGALCRRLDGLPLAIEMAAARTTIASPGQILERLGAGLRFLTSAGKDVPARHESLHTALTWSFDLLMPNARDFLQELSLFRGNFTADWAQKMTGRPDAIELLETLRDASLLSSVCNHNFRILETIKEHINEKSNDKLLINHKKYILFGIQMTNNQNIIDILPDMEILNLLSVCSKNPNYHDYMVDILDNVVFSPGKRGYPFLDVSYFVNFLIRKSTNTDKEFNIIYHYLFRKINFSAPDSINLLNKLENNSNNLQLPDRYARILTLKYARLTHLAHCKEALIICHQTIALCGDQPQLLYYKELSYINASTIHERMHNTTNSINYIKYLISTSKNPYILLACYINLCDSHIIKNNYKYCNLILNHISKSYKFQDEPMAMICFFHIQARCLLSNKEYQSAFDIIIQNFSHCYKFIIIQFCYVLFEDAALYYLSQKNYEYCALFFGISQSTVMPTIIQTEEERKRVQEYQKEIPMHLPEVSEAWNRGRTMNPYEATRMIVEGEIILP